MGSGAHTYEATHDWGVLPPQIKWGNTHGVVEDAQGHIYVHHTVHATSDSADTMVVFDGKGKFVRSWGKEFRGVAHGLQLRKEGRDEFLYLTVNAANPKMTPQPEMQAVVVKTTLKGEIVWKIQGPPDIDGYKPGAGRRAEALQPDQRRDRAERRRLRRRRLRLVLHQPVQRARPSTSARSAARGSEPGKLAEPHGIWIDTRGGSPILVVADRRNNRLQRFTLDGKHVDFVPGFRLPCHFDEHKGLVVDSRSARPRHADGQDTTRSSRISATRTPRTGTTRCAREPRDKFIPGQFICPHGACFDHDGNIFVVEWVEVGRVTKLRKV